MSELTNTTKALHAGYQPASAERNRAVPTYGTTGYVFNNTDHAANLFGLREFGYIYTRLNNPTNDVLEQRLAQLEGGAAAAVFSSGTGATTSAFLTLLKSGDHVVSSNSLYGGTFNLLKVLLPRFGITTTFVDPSNPQNFKDAVQENTRVIFAESVGNPKLDILDLEAIGNVAKEVDLPFMVDNTLATPALLNPIQYGANIVIHSLTKYIEGHGSALGGVVIDAANYNWDNGKFPELTEPSPGYHGLKYFETFQNLSFIVKLRVEGLRDIGAALSPYSASLILRGLESLTTRIEKHSANALALAQWLETLPEVAWVNYPGLSSSKYNGLTQKYLPKGQSGILTFGLNGGFDAAKKFTDATELFSLVANFGDSKSLIIHPASTTHQQLTEEEQLSTGVSPDLIRLSIGLENVEDLKNDIKQALTKI